MSRIQAGRVLDIGARMQNVLGTLGSLPPVLLRAMAERNFDTLTHHRQSVLKHHKLPGRRRAQKMLAANLKRYVRDIKSPASVKDLEGEGFAAQLSGQSKWGDFLRNLEEGGSLSPGENGRFAVPLIRPKRFRELLAEGRLTLVPGKNILIEETKGRGAARRGARTIIWGFLLKRRQQRALLGYFDRFDAVVQEESPEYDRDIERSLTAAGRARLDRTISANGAARQAFADEFRRYIGTNPGKFAEARKAAAEVAREVRRAARATKGGE